VQKEFTEHGEEEGEEQSEEVREDDGEEKRQEEGEEEGGTKGERCKAGRQDDPARTLRPVKPSRSSRDVQAVATRQCSG